MLYGNNRSPGDYMGRNITYTAQLLFDILRALYAYEQMGKAPSTTDLAKFLSKDYGVIIRYRNTLEELGLVEVTPVENQNIVRLTEKGRCLARCLVS